MLESNAKAVNSDVKSLVNDTQDLINAASAVASDKAEELRNKGKTLLDSALAKAQDVQTTALKAGKEMAGTADDYVKQNPWRTIAFSAGIGLLLGVILGRK